jgi:hypothetical protein
MQKKSSETGSVKKHNAKIKYEQEILDCSKKKINKYKRLAHKGNKT